MHALSELPLLRRGKRQHARVGVIERSSEFFTHDGHFRWRVDADADAAAGEFHHRYGDIIADENAFADLSSEDEHGRGTSDVGQAVPDVCELLSGKA